MNFLHTIKLLQSTGLYNLRIYYLQAVTASSAPAGNLRQACRDNLR